MYGCPICRATSRKAIDLPAQSTSITVASFGANMIEAKPPPCGPSTTFARAKRRTISSEGSPESG